MGTVGARGKVLYIPLHKLTKHLGATMCNILIKAQILNTDCDVTSNVGKKP